MLNYTLCLYLQVLCTYPNLQILYLHGNQINEIKEVDKLGDITTLKKLCLHGNPIETIKVGYLIIWQ